jgi:hypothetical protein
MIRVDVPSVDGTPAFTKLFGVASIYAITPTTEDVCRRFIEYHKPVPMMQYIPAERKLPIVGDGEQYCGTKPYDYDEDYDQ